MRYQTRHFRDTDDFDRGNLPGFFQLISKDSEVICLRKCSQVSENVEYPIVFHLNSRFQWLMKS